MSPEDAEYPLIFPTRRVSRRVWALLILLLVSLFVHAGSFYILQVAYTPTVTLPPPPAELTLLAPASAENIALNHWLAIADPALITQPARDRDALVPLSFHYVPSYAAAPPAYRPLDLTPIPLPPLAGDLFGPAPLPPMPPAHRPPVPSPPSKVRLDPALAALVVHPLPPIALRAVETEVKSLEPTVFLVGVSEKGGAPLVFRQSSSGNPMADDYAREYLARLSFPPSPPGNPASWGWATFFWGVDVFH